MTKRRKKHTPAYLAALEKAEKAALEIRQTGVDPAQTETWLKRLKMRYRRALDEAEQPKPVTIPARPALLLRGSESILLIAGLLPRLRNGKLLETVESLVEIEIRIDPLLQPLEPKPAEPMKLRQALALSILALDEAMVLVGATSELGEELREASGILRRTRIAWLNWQEA